MTLILSRYGINLRRVENSDIELIRKWRNHPDIRKYMEYQKKISKAQQIKWFSEINNELNYYLMINVGGKDVGVINCRDVNLIDNYGEGGIFIWDKEYLKSPIPVFASIILIDFIFNELKIGDKSFIRIMKNNVRAIEYNKALGYFLIPGQVGVKNQWYLLTRDGFNKKAKKIMIAAKNYTETGGELKVKGEVSPLNTKELNDYLEQIS